MAKNCEKEAARKESRVAAKARAREWMENEYVALRVAMRMQAGPDVAAEVFGSYNKRAMLEKYKKRALLRKWCHLGGVDPGAVRYLLNAGYIPTNWSSSVHVGAWIINKEKINATKGR